MDDANARSIGERRDRSVETNDRAIAIDAIDRSIDRERTTSARGRDGRIDGTAVGDDARATEIGARAR